MRSLAAWSQPRRAVVATMALALALSVVVVAHADASPLHGIGFFKGCATPTQVGQKTRCDFTITNSFDPDILTVTSIVDVVHGGAGDDNSGNILSQLDLK